METSILQNLLWIGGGLAAVGTFLVIKKMRNVKKKTPVEEVRHDDSREQRRTQEPHRPTVDNRTSAKDGFISHLSKFSPMLDSLRGKMDTQAWEEAIVSTNNGELIQMWRRTKPQAWETILQMWGIKCDVCSSFTAVQAYKDMYRVADGSEIVVGEKYHVEQPCWILTTYNEENKAIKHVVKVGVVTKM